MTTPAFVMFALMLALTVAGLPIAVAIGLSAGLVMTCFNLVTLDLIPQLLLSSIDSWILIAVPMFILAGSIISASSIGQRLVDLFNSLFGMLPGGLAASAVFTCFLFGGLTGSAAAETAAVASVMTRPMVRAGYPAAFVGSLVAAAGTNANLVPPSIALLIYGIVARVSIAELFVAGVVPGLLFAALLATTASIIAAQRGYGRRTLLVRLPPGQALYRSAWAVVAPLWIIGGLRYGVFTPTESSFFITVYAFVVAKYFYGDIGWRNLPQIIETAAVTSIAVMIIVACASVFAWLVNIMGVPGAIEGLFREADLGFAGTVVLMMLVLLIAGMFLDASSVLLIIVPILIPVARAISFDPVQFGIFITVGINLGLVTPPVGVGLFIGAKVAGASVVETSLAAVPWFLVFGVLFAAIAFVPGISLFLVR